MKRLTSLLLALCLALCLLPCASAEEGESAAERGLALIRTARNWRTIELPQEESYLDAWKTRYPRKAWYAPNLPVRKVPQLTNDGDNAPQVYEGTTVTVVAEENDMSCILYRAPSFKLYVGWIQSIRLLEDFPGETLVSGMPREAELREQEEPEFAWEAAWLCGAWRQVTALGEPVSGCVGFELEYQIIKRNNTRAEAFTGTRRIYVHDGESWREVGSFPYDALGAVRVQVWLDEPLTFSAIAVVAECAGGDLITVRHTARHFLVQERAAAK